MRRGGIVKILQYCEKVGRFPLHNDEPRDKRLFRISVSLADGIPDFAMCFDGYRRTFVMARGRLHGGMAVVVMDMHAAGRPHGPSGEGLIKHGTVRTPKTNCTFVVFDVEADSWEELLLMIDVWMELLGGPAVGTAVKFVSDFAPTDWADSSGKLKKLFQFGPMKNGNALVEHEEMETAIDEAEVQVHRIKEGQPRRAVQGACAP
jgi:hypothetical protein